MLSRNNMGSNRVAPELSPSPRSTYTPIGQYKLVLRGALLLGPNFLVLLANFILLYANAAVFFIWVAPRIHIALIAIVGAALLWVSGCLVRTSFTDAGILPRQRRELMISTKFAEDIAADWDFCSICLVWRPPRTKHCRQCDCCIMDFDHHCPWVSNCVGRRNRRFFVAFVVSVASLCVFVCFWDGFLLVREMLALGGVRGLQDNIPAAVQFVLMLILGAVLGKFAAYHVRLAASNLTTFEDLRGQNPHVPRPAHWRGGCSIVCTDWANDQSKLTTDVRRLIVAGTYGLTFNEGERTDLATSPRSDWEFGKGAEGKAELSEFSGFAALSGEQRYPGTAHRGDTPSGVSPRDPAKEMSAHSPRIQELETPRVEMSTYGATNTGEAPSKGGVSLAISEHAPVDASAPQDSESQAGEAPAPASPAPPPEEGGERGSARPARLPPIGENIGMDKLRETSDRASARVLRDNDKTGRRGSLSPGSAPASARSALGAGQPDQWCDSDREGPESSRVSRLRTAEIIQ